MKTSVWIMGILAVAFCPVVTWADDSYMTYGKANGKYWAETLGNLPGETAQFAKTGYIQGLEDGLTDYMNESGSARRMLETLEGIPMNDKLKALDKAFSEEANGSIPIPSMLALLCSKIKGDISQDEYDSLLEVMRTRYSQR